MTLTHRHLNIAAGTPVDQLPLDALDDVLEQGDLEDWLGLAIDIRDNPDGPVAQRILKLCQAHDMYGTSRLWPAFIESLRPDGEEQGAPLRLAELRHRTGRTQADVAETLGISQSDVSKLERRSDLRVSTLRRYVAAIGGELEVAGRFGDELMVVDWGRSATTASSARL